MVTDSIHCRLFLFLFLFLLLLLLLLDDNKGRAVTTSTSDADVDVEWNQKQKKNCCHGAAFLVLVLCMLRLMLMLMLKLIQYRNNNQGRTKRIMLGPMPTDRQAGWQTGRQKKEGRISSTSSNQVPIGLLFDWLFVFVYFVGHAWCASVASKVESNKANTRKTEETKRSTRIHCTYVHVALPCPPRGASRFPPTSVACFPVHEYVRGCTRVLYVEKTVGTLQTTRANRERLRRGNTKT